ncbi:MAG: helix-turn-helix domain-containing protein [Clostridium sp.]|uniref:helix-turn-helix domain-containing protein n=1 Tax=Clostridium sp. TaxID=1506 RepID=UPI003EE4AA1D
MDEKENTIDAEFEEVKSEQKDSAQDKNINIVEPTYYTTKQVAEIIEEPDSTVRYWSRYFEKHLEFIYSNKNRAYTKQDVNRLLQVSQLKRRGMTLKQIEEYFLDDGFQDSNGELDLKNPLAMEVFMEALTKNIDDKMKQFQKQMTANILAMQKMMLASQGDMQEEFKKQIAITIDEAVTDKMSEFTGDLKGVVGELGDNVSEKVENSLKNVSSEFEKIDKVLESNKELETKLNDFIARDEKRDKEVVDKIKTLLDKKETERVELLKVENENKGFFSKLFGK